MMNRLSVSCGALALAVALLQGCKGKAAEEKEAAAKPVVAASTALAVNEPFTETISALGEVSAPSEHFASLSAANPSRISKVLVTAGQRVAAGTALIEFDQTTTEAAATSADAALTAAQKAHERAQRLSAEGIIPQKDVEQSAADLAKARADVVLAHRDRDLSVLRAPIAGTIIKLAATIGAAADAGQVLVEIADPAGFEVTASIAPVSAAHIQPGAEVRLSNGDRGNPESAGTGHVAAVGASVDSATRTVPIRIRLDHASRALRLGESVSADIALGSHTAVVIPAAALLPGEEVGTYKVFVVDEKGVALPRNVSVGGRTSEKVEIKEGLKAGERVVAQGAFSVEDSAKVSKTVPAKPE